MNHKSFYSLIALFSLVLVCALPGVAQQKGQWVPGQSGLNAGLLPDPGITVMNMTVNYSADSLTDSAGNAVPGVKGTYGFWLPETLVYYVPKTKVLGGKLAFAGVFPAVKGSLTAPVFDVTAGGVGYADTMIQPFTLGWHLRRVDTFVGYAFMAPTGRYSPAAKDNVGTGYWGHHILTGTTLSVTKKGTTLNLLTDWEIHGHKHGTDMTPGQTFTMEWGLGQNFPLAKDFSKILQVGLIGYDQWQVTENGGTLNGLIPASTVPMYSVHAIGFQTTFILPKKGLNFFFRYEPEYLAKAHAQGRTVAFGGGYTFRFPTK
jgi:hypothetical protein